MKVGIKAAGGISSFADAEKFIELGASRLGTSRLVTIAKNQGDIVEKQSIVSRSIIKNLIRMP